MIKSNHKIDILSRDPCHNVGVLNDGLEPTKVVMRPKMWKSLIRFVDFCKIVWEISDFFNISHILSFRKMLFRSLKKLCDEFLWKVWDVHFIRFVHADRLGIWLFFGIQNCLMVNWPRKWVVLHFYKNSKISQNILQKSATFKTDFLIFGRVKKMCVSEHIIFYPQLFVGGF